MIGQHGISRRSALPPVRYKAIRGCLQQVRAFALEQQAYVQMPRIGCGLAGGRWEEVSLTVEEELAANKVQVVVYDLPL